MPNMTIMPLNRVVQAIQGGTILQAMLAAGIEAPHKCNGEAKCARACPKCSVLKMKSSTASSASAPSRAWRVRP